MRHTTKQLFAIPVCMILGLGYRRGIHAYDYVYNSRRFRYEPYLYSTRMGYGIVGAFVYMCPAFYIILLPKEVYRFEVYMRNLKDEQNTNFYNELL